MKFDPFTGPGSTPARRRFWNEARAAVLSLRKAGGRNVTVDEHEGQGTFINIADTSARRAGGGGGTGACCKCGECSILTAADCALIGGDFKGVGTTCDPNPCEFVCDGSVSVHHEISVTVSGSCDSGITFDGSGSDSADTTFNSLSSPPVGTAIYCTSNGQPEINDENSSLTVTCGAETQDGFIFLSALLVRITTAGTINSNSYDVGDWVLLVGSISNDWPGFGDCDTCSGTFIAPADHQVFPNVPNTLVLTQGGVTNTIDYTFSASC